MMITTSIWQTFGAGGIFTVGLLIIILIRNTFKVSLPLSVGLYLWHTIFCLLNYGYTVRFGSDSLSYYKISQNVGLDLGFGTAGVQYITSFFSVGLGLSMFGTFLAFNIFGSIGLLAFQSSLKIAASGKSRTFRRLVSLIVFLPSISFWSSGLSKDSLSFMATGLALWAAINLSQRIKLFVFATLIMLLVRPHIAALMIFSASLGFILSSKLSVRQRLVFGSLTIFAAAAAIPFAMNYAGLGSDASTIDLVEYIGHKQNQYQDTGAGVDIASMSLPMQLFTYLFRPLPFEARSVTSLAAALDNSLLLYLFVIGGWTFVKQNRRRAEGNRIFLWVYGLSTWTLLSLTTANLGIAVRQKWMFAPILIYLLISLMGKYRGNYGNSELFTRQGHVLDSSAK